MSQINENLERVKSRIETAVKKSGRKSGDVRLVAVSKMMPAEKVVEVLETGQKLFGENKVQEAREKIPLVGGDAEWHMIGRLQKNKAKYIPGLFTMVHSVDSFELAEALDLAMARALERGKVLNSEILHILIQVNIALEESKGGARETELINLIEKISTLSHLKIKGLMVIPPYSENTEETSVYFEKLRQLRDKIAAMNLPNVDMKELSMGMSHDFEVAIEEGATLVRVGSAIFGERNYA